MSKRIKTLPMVSVLDDIEEPIALWHNDRNVCELNEDGTCSTGTRFYGTEDMREPKFCYRHFFTQIVSGDGKTNYKLKILHT